MHFVHQRKREIAASFTHLQKEGYCVSYFRITKNLYPPADNNNCITTSV